MKKTLFLTLSFLLLSMGYLVAQTTKTTGVVLDESGQPQIGVAVVVKGTTVGTTTDMNGRFVLKVPVGSKYLHFSLVGTTAKDVKVTPQMQVVLSNNDKMLGEVIVTGYGVTRKTAFTGSATTVGNKAITQKSDPDFMQSLAGNVSGLQLTSNTNAPGSKADITIRGVGSYSAGTQPLYVIDGVPMLTDALGGDWGGDQYVSPLVNISPADIESVTVLKDASATAIYGSRAANGVIVITTKHNSQGKLNIHLNVKKGFATPGYVMKGYMPVNDVRWQDIWSKGLINSGKTLAEAQSAVSDELKTLGYRGFNTDWFNSTLRNGDVDDYSLDFSGKTGQTNYYVSGNYYRNNGILINTSLNRYSTRMNLDTKYKFITFGVNLSGSYSISDGSATSNVYTNPIVPALGEERTVEPIYNEDGTYNTNALHNPVAANDKNEGDIHRQKFTMANLNPYISLDLTHGFYWKSSLGVNYLSVNQYEYWSSLYNPQGRQERGVGQAYEDTRSNIVITNTLNWLKTFNAAHNLNLLLGQEAQMTSDFTQAYGATNYPIPDHRDMKTASNPIDGNNLSTYRRLASYFFNGQYDYLSRYYLSASMRADGSSSFGINHRWGVFWSLGAKWRLSEEKFFANIKSVIDNLNIRASYGTVGNSDIDWYAGRGVYATGFPYFNQPGMMPIKVDNPNLGWESRNKFNVGLDMDLFNRVSFTMDVYDERTSDLLFPVPISMTAGISDLTDAGDDTPTMLKNIGEMENYGVELNVNANIIKTKDLVWDFNANITFNKNKMLKLANQNNIIPDDYSIITPGQPLHTFYLKKWAGVNPDTGAPQWYKADGTITSNYNDPDVKRQICGNAEPKFYGGFGTTLHYKGFDLSANFNYSYGRKIYGSTLSKFGLQTGSNEWGNVTNYTYEHAWTPQNRFTNVPKFVYANNDNAQQISDRFLMDGSFLKMKNITLGYTIPKDLTRKWYLQNVRLFASADNLFSVFSSDYLGLDPEDDADGIQNYKYPMMRTFTFGLNVSF